MLKFAILIRSQIACWFSGVTLNSEVRGSNLSCYLVLFFYLGNIFLVLTYALQFRVPELGVGQRSGLASTRALEIFSYCLNTTIM